MNAFLGTATFGFRSRREERKKKKTRRASSTVKSLRHLHGLTARSCHDMFLLCWCLGERRFEAAHEVPARILAAAVFEFLTSPFCVALSRPPLQCSLSLRPPRRFRIAIAVGEFRSAAGIQNLTCTALPWQAAQAIARYSASAALPSSCATLPFSCVALE